MFGVHVRLDFKNESGKRRVSWFDLSDRALPGLRRGGILEELIEQKLNAEIIAGAAEENRRCGSGQHITLIEVAPSQFQDFQFFADFFKGRIVEPFANQRFRNGTYRDRSTISAARGALEKMNLFAEPVIDAFEVGAGANRPIDRERADTKDAFDFVQER